MNSIDLGSLNYLAIIAGVIINQVLGAAWYGGLAKPWMAEVGFTEEDMEAIKGTPKQWVPLHRSHRMRPGVHKFCLAVP